MTHIRPKTRQDLPELEPVLQAAESLMGFLPTSVLTMAHWPELTQAFAGLGATILAGGELDPGLKQLIAYAVSNAAGCRYCQAHTANSAEKKNVNIEKIKNAFDFESSDLFSDQERAALQVAYHAGMVPNAVDADQMQALAKHFSPKQCIEIVSVISLFGFLNRWNDTLGTTLEDAPKTFALENLSSLGWVAGKHA